MHRVLGMIDVPSPWHLNRKSTQNLVMAFVNGMAIAMESDGYK